MLPCCWAYIHLATAQYHKVMCSGGLCKSEIYKTISGSTYKSNKNSAAHLLRSKKLHPVSNLKSRPNHIKDGIFFFRVSFGLFPGCAIDRLPLAEVKQQVSINGVLHDQQLPLTTGANTDNVDDIWMFANLHHNIYF